MKDLIFIRGLEKSYGEKQILKGVDLSISHGEYVSIIGPSGSGKSTLMSIIGLIEGFDSGKYVFEDREITPGKDEAKLRLEKIGFIFQAFHLIPEMTVSENIVLPFIYKNQKKDPKEIMEEMGISHLEKRYPGSLSGGEKQRVAIARALIGNPTLIIADEPTGNLDPENKEIVSAYLEKAHNKGKTILLITHDIELSQKTQKVYHLKNGLLYE